MIIGIGGIDVSIDSCESWVDIAMTSWIWGEVSSVGIDDVGIDVGSILDVPRINSDKKNRSLSRFIIG